MGLEFGIDAEFEAKYTFYEILFDEGIPYLCSSDMFCLGPYVSMAANLTFDIDVEGKVLVSLASVFLHKPINCMDEDHGAACYQLKILQASAMKDGKDNP